MSRMRRELAALTIVQEEPVFLPIWLRHYSSYLEPKDLYVINHEPAASTLSDVGKRAWQLALTNATARGVNLIPAHRTTSFDHRWLADTVAAMVIYLLQSYEWVLFAEADELVFAAPEFDDLRGFLAARRSDFPVARATGYELIQVDGETGLGEEESVRIENLHWLHGKCRLPRNYWYPTRAYSKPILTSVPVRWQKGFHDLEADDQRRRGEPESGLLLAHLHRIDVGIAFDRAQATSRRTWSPVDQSLGLGSQNRIATLEGIQRDFRSHVDNGGPIAELAVVPDAVRPILGLQKRSED